MKVKILSFPLECRLCLQKHTKFYFLGSSITGRSRSGWFCGWCCLNFLAEAIILLGNENTYVKKYIEEKKINKEDFKI